MLKNFILNNVLEISKFLLKHKDFFEKKSDARTKFLDDVTIPHSIKEYLAEATEEQFLRELQNTTAYLQNPAKTKIEGNGLLAGIAEFLANSFANDIYKLPMDFYKSARQDQTEIVSKLIKSQSALATSLKEILVNHSNQQVYGELAEFVNAVMGSPFVIIQSPVEISADQKKEVRDTLKKETKKEIFPIFQVNRSLIGGLRIFIDGEVKDYSWMGRINFITNLK